MTTLADRCSFTSEARGDDLSGTAPPASRFLLIEQPGPWGRLALEQSRLDPGIGVAVARAAARSHTRPLLIRRPGRSAETGERRWFLATTTPGSATLRTGVVTQDSELEELLHSENPGVPVEGPLYAVCTHGKHDACCAVRGRPVVQALESRVGDAAWEVSHLGGDRFAANVLVLPWGLYYGRVSDADALVDATESGQVQREFLRGRSAFQPAAQAAQKFARDDSGDDRIDVHRPRGLTTLDPMTVEVVLDDHANITVRKEPAGEPAFLTCGSGRAQRAPTWTRL